MLRLTPDDDTITPCFECALLQDNNNDDDGLLAYGQWVVAGVLEETVHWS